MKIIASLSIILFSVTVFAVPNKGELRARWDDLSAKLDEIGMLETVMASKDVSTLGLDPDLYNEIITLRDDYREFVLAQRQIQNRVLEVIPETEPNDALGQANLFGENDAFNANIAVGGTDEDWFSFNVMNTDEVVILNVTNTTGVSATSDSVLEIYDPSGTFLFSDDDGGAVGGESRAAFFAPAPGTYYARVIPFDAASSVEPYDLYFIETMLADSGVSLNVGDSNDHPFTAEAGDTVQITVFVDSTATDYDLDIFLLDPSLTQIDSAESGASNFEYLSSINLPVSGQYTANVFCFDVTGPPTPYSISIDVSGSRINAIPTLSTWGMIVFTMLLMGSAVFFMRRRFV